MNKTLLSLIMLFSVLNAFTQENRYINTTSIGILSGTSNSYHAAPLSFLSEHQVRFHHFMAAGLMIGIEQLNENTLPLALSYRMFTNSGGFKFFLGAYTGYSVSLEKPDFLEADKSKGGILAGTEAGALIRINGCASLIIGMGYRYSELHYNMYNTWGGDYKRSFTFNRFSVRIGIVI
jgi:hypothetical protein